MISNTFFLSRHIYQLITDLDPLSKYNEENFNYIKHFLLNGSIIFLYQLFCNINYKRMLSLGLVKLNGNKEDLDLLHNLAFYILAVMLQNIHTQIAIIMWNKTIGRNE